MLLQVTILCGVLVAVGAAGYFACKWFADAYREWDK